MVCALGSFEYTVTSVTEVMVVEINCVRSYSFFAEFIKGNTVFTRLPLLT